MKYTPIIVLVILALGITAVALYRPHGTVRVNAIDLDGAPVAASTGSLLARHSFAGSLREMA
jgi:hypothetical protein